MNRKVITQEILKELLHYDPRSGKFTWLESRGGKTINEEAGSTNAKGYRYIQIDGKLYNASRLAFLYMEGYFPENEVDHINRKPSDNWWKNLREVSRQCNMRNCSLPSNNKSGVKGVVWYSRNQKWHAHIKVDGKKYHLGCFDNFDEAVCMRLAAEQCLNWAGCDSESSAYKYVKEMLTL